MTFHTNNKELKFKFWHFENLENMHKCYFYTYKDVDHKIFMTILYIILAASWDTLMVHVIFYMQ